MANNFSGDPSCKALWDFESGALATDSIGSNTLNLVGSPSADTSKFKEGAASLLLNGSSQYGYIPNGSLPSSFPLKGGSSNLQFTIGGWIYQAATESNAITPWSKYDYASSQVGLLSDVKNGILYIAWGHAQTQDTINTGLTVSPATWYYLAVIADGVNNYLRVVLYNATAGTFQSWWGTPTTTMGVNTADFQVGNSGTYGVDNQATYWNGDIDELVVFNRLLSLGEIENIINQVYTGPYAAASPGNIFTGDSRFQAVWDFESGALTTDSSPAAGGNGANTLTASGSSLPTADPFGVEEGADAAYFPNYGYFNIADSALSTNFPLKSTDTVKKITWCGWVIPVAWPSSFYDYLWWKNNGSDVGAGAAINTSGHLIVMVGNQAFGTVYDTGFVLNKYGIYHVACVIDGLNGTLNVRVYNFLTQTASDYSTSISTVSLGNGDFSLGYNHASGMYFQGWLDEVVVANALLSDAEIDEIRGEIFGAPITRNLSTTASVVSSTSSVMLGVTRKLATSPAVSTSTGSPLLNILRKLTCSPAAGSSTSAVMLAVLRKLACSPAVVSSVSTPNLAVQRNLATLAVALSETSDTVYLNLNAVRQLSTIAAVVSSTSAVNLAILRKLVSECVVVTSTPGVMLAVLRKLTTDIPVVSTTSAAELGYLLRLATAANVTTETPAIMLQVLRRLLTRVAVQTETSAAQLIITAAPVPLPPSLHSLAEGWLAGEVPTEDLFKASQAWLAGEEQKAEE